MSNNSELRRRSSDQDRERTSSEEREFEERLRRENERRSTDVIDERIRVRENNKWFSLMLKNKCIGFGIIASVVIIGTVLCSQFIYGRVNRTLQSDAAKAVGDQTIIAMKPNLYLFYPIPSRDGLQHVKEEGVFKVFTDLTIADVKRLPEITKLIETSVKPGTGVNIHLYDGTLTHKIAGVTVTKDGLVEIKVDSEYWYINERKMRKMNLEGVSGTLMIVFFVPEDGELRFFRPEGSQMQFSHIFHCGLFFIPF